MSVEAQKEKGSSRRSRSSVAKKEKKVEPVSGEKKVEGAQKAEFHREGEKYLWNLPEWDQDVVREIACSLNMSMPIVQTLLRRGYTSRAELDQFLFATMEQVVGNPALLKDAEKAVERLRTAIKQGERILVCGDYDVDGITSSAMMMICMLPLGAKINFFLPHRVRHGYGLSAEIVKRAAENNYKVIVTVDNGISAFEAAEAAQAAGIDLIITDHHKPHAEVPNSFALIDPHQEDCGYPFKYLAGVGVTFKLLSLLYQQLNRELPEKVYELLMLGTVADVVPLVGENRFWVRYGLQMVNKLESLALRVLKQNVKFSKPALTSLDIGFFIAPQINALGRLEDARQGVTFLIGSQEQEVERIGMTLGHLNEARKQIERGILNEIVESIESGKIDLASERVVLATSRKWQPGVIGLVASRIVGAYNRPAILLHVGADGKAKGSCRSVPEYNIFEALEAQRDLLTSFGGHALAAGLSLPVEKVSLLKERLEAHIREVLPEVAVKPLLDLDAELNLPEVRIKLLRDIDFLEPFGNENRQPLFYLPAVSVVEKPVLLKDAHVKCKLFQDGMIKPAIFFNRPDLYDILAAHKDKEVAVAARISRNYFAGRMSVELEGFDVAV